MVVEEFPNLIQWLFAQGALTTFAYILAFSVVGGLLLGFVVASFRHGPSEAFFAISKTVFQAVPDLLGMSTRRIWAIAVLAMKENRRLFVVTLVLFVGALLVAGWFLSGGTPYPERGYVSFLFFSTQLLVTVFAVLVSAFSLPNDIISRTIYTIVTKPVRASEIVLGRLVGFTLLGTVLLGVIGVLSLIFINRGLSHTHTMTAEIASDDWLPIVDGLTPDGMRPFHPLAVFEAKVRTDRENDHEHRIAIIQMEDGDFEVVVDETSGHTHPVEILETDVATNRPSKILIGQSEGNLRARLPIYASGRTEEEPAISYTDDTGAPSEGTNVGEMWDYQKYIQGGTQATAIFRFDGISADKFDNLDQINLDLSVAVYRTHKGNIRKRVLGEIELRNVVDASETQTAQKKSVLISFESEEFKVQTLELPRKFSNGTIVTGDGQTKTQQELDFFDDLAAGGQLDVILRCTDDMQYMGVARPSVYFHAGDTSFGWNFARGFLGIWAQMIVVISLTVALSTFLKGPVVMIGTVGIVVFGFAGRFMNELASSVLGGDKSLDIFGGGPVEALYRLLTQMNLQQPLPEGVGYKLIEFIDERLLLPTMNSIAYAVPRFSDFNLSNYLAYGYTIDNQQLLINLVVAVTFSVSMAIFGYFCFKTREIAAA